MWQSSAIFIESLNTFACQIPHFYSALSRMLTLVLTIFPAMEADEA